MGQTKARVELVASGLQCYWHKLRKKIDCVKMTISRSHTSHDNSVKDNFYEDSKSEQKTP